MGDPTETPPPGQGPGADPALNNTTDWRYLLPQALRPPYLLIKRYRLSSEGVGSEATPLGTIPPLWAVRAASAAAHDAGLRGTSYSLVACELEVERPLWPTSSVRLRKLLARLWELTAPGGYIYLAMRHHAAAVALPRYVEYLMSAVGFCDCRSYYVLPSHAYPMHLIPAGSAQAFAYYLDHVTTARSRKRQRIVSLAKLGLRIRLGPLMRLAVPCVATVARRDP